jgi:hypothetical protein
MMRVGLLTLLVLVALSPRGRAESPGFPIVTDGKPAAVIVLPAAPDQFTKEASEWLVEYLQKASGAKLKVLLEKEGVDPPTGPRISVGHTRLAALAKIDLSKLKWDGCRLVVVGDTLFLIGRDDFGTETHDWVGARGTCRAVIRFLEQHCGVRWFLPSPEGEFVPASQTIVVPRNLDDLFQPAFAYSDGRSVYDTNVFDNPGRSLAAQANNYRKAVKAAPGGHTYYHAVPADRYFAKHPEYFALLDGKRTGKGNHLCTSHPDVQRLLVEHLQKRFDQGLEWVSLGQEDGYLRCQCDNCESLDDYRFSDWHKKHGGRWETYQRTALKETPPERLFLLHKSVADQITNKHPGKKVMLMCYAPTAWPSHQIPSFGDNVIAELMNLSPNYIEAWKGKVGGFTGFTYWFNTQCPMGLNVHVTPQEVSDRVRFLHQSGFLAVSFDPDGTWGFEGPVFYLLGRLMGDPSLDPDATITEYCEGVYGEAGKTMHAFFRLLHERLGEVVPVADEDIAIDVRNTRLPRWLTTSQMFLAMYPPEVLAQLNGFLTTAESEAKTERTRGWVRLSRDHFDFVRLLTEMLIAYRAWQVKQSPVNWADLKLSVDAFEAYRVKIVGYEKSYTDVWFPGHGTFCKWLVGNLEHTDKSFYLPWEKRKEAVLKAGLRGRAMGYGNSYYYSFITKPLTLDFSKKPGK